MNDYDRVARVIRYLDEHQQEQPNLSELADHAGLSSFHFHRLFTRWAGVTPKDFLQCLTLTHAMDALRSGENVLDASLDAGLSGPGRLHDLCVKFVAASPGEVKSKGEGWTIEAGFAASPFGTCLIGESPRGICHLSFVDSGNRQAGEEVIRQDWTKSQIQWSLDAERITTLMFASANANPKSPLRVLVRGTDFQVRVWRALLEVPPGALTTYGRIAQSLGDRAAARAVGAAVGQNRLAWLIPCHRVIRETGAFGDYRWGITRKKAIVAWEGAVRHS